MKDKLISLLETKEFLWRELTMDGAADSDAHYIADVVCALLDDVPVAKQGEEDIS